MPESRQACPFCGLLCNDVVAREVAGRLTVEPGQCPLAERGFEQAQAPAAESRIGGRVVSRDQALDEAARRLRACSLPVISGLAVDVGGMRALVELAHRCRAVVDHGNSDAKMRNLLTMQTDGWMSATLSEVRHRADRVVFIGATAGDRQPRLFERLFGPGPALFERQPPVPRQLVFLADRVPAAAQALADASAGALTCAAIPVATGDLPRALGVLSAILQGRMPAAKDVAASGLRGIDLPALQALAADLRQARYAVLAWAAAELDYPHAELTVATAARIVRLLNRDTRAACLPLGGNDADLTSDAVLLWQTGLPFRTAFREDVLRYDPVGNRAQRLIDDREADLLLWVSSLNPGLVPRSHPDATIVFGHPAMRLEREPDVFIPVGVPAFDHPSHLFRSDKVVAIHYEAKSTPARPPLPGVAATVQALLTRLAADAGVRC